MVVEVQRVGVCDGSIVEREKGREGRGGGGSVWPELSYKAMKTRGGRWGVGVFERYGWWSTPPSVVVSVVGFCQLV